MKRNRTIICGVVCAAVLLICTAGLILRAGSLGLGTGRVLLANGETILICANMPIQLTNKSGNDALFARLSDGDRVLVLHSAIAESYPGRADAYALLKVGEGSIADIPDAVLEQLALLGWHTDVKMEMHSVSMACTDWLYEEPPSFARAGETVNVKISKAYDVGYLFLVNGEQIEMHDDTDDYWLFS
ncbi:MAG: hypothetical protein J6S76_02170, partial [Clostridia bacterium]|nr:hypothetical protein [Clostridia bacterium]